MRSLPFASFVVFSVVAAVGCDGCNRAEAIDETLDIISPLPEGEGEGGCRNGDLVESNDDAKHHLL